MKTLQQSSAVSTSFISVSISVLLVLGVGGVFFVSSSPAYAKTAISYEVVSDDSSFLAQSTDGSHVLVRTSEGDATSLVLRDTTHHTSEVLVHNTNTVLVSGVLSGDGSTVAFETYSPPSQDISSDASQAQYHLSLYQRSQHTVVHVAHSPQPMFPALNGDGSVLVFRKLNGANSQLFKYNMHNSSIAILASKSGEMSDISITHDGGLVLLRRTTDPSGRAARVELYDATAPEQKVTSVSDADTTPFAPTMSSTGRYVAYIARDTRGTWWYTPTWRVMVYDRIAATSTDVFDAPGLSTTLSISGDGRFVGYVTVGNIAATLYVHDTQTHQNAPIAASGRGVNVRREMLSGNGASLAFDTSEHLVAGYGGRLVVYMANNPLFEASVGAQTQTDMPAENSILFLPGFEASRLYEGDKKLWEPVGDASVEHLRMDDHANIQARDVIDKAYGQFGVYDVFFDRMNMLKQSGAIVDWKAFPYDWRLPVDDVVANTALIDTLKHLATTSKTGKVTIVAHSGGGLIAKALMSKLGSDASQYVDKVVLVGVPQVGTPEAVAGLLHGYEQGIPFTLSQSAARALGNTMPGAYALLPSEGYFSLTLTPVIKIHSMLPQWHSAYGGRIDSADTMRAFLADTSGKVASHASTDTTRPLQLSQSLLTQARVLHDTIDNWTPPHGVHVVQIAGWGVRTLDGIEYGSNRLAEGTLTMKAHHTADGDGTVVAASALALPAQANVESTWFDLNRYNVDHKRETTHGLIPFNHANLLDIPELDDFIIGAATTSHYLSTVDMSTSTVDATNTDMSDDSTDDDLALLDTVEIPDIPNITDIANTSTVPVVFVATPTTTELVATPHALHLTLFRVVTPQPVNVSALLEQVTAASTSHWLFEEASTTILY